MVKHRIFVSVPMDTHLDERHNRIVEAVLKLVREAGFEPQRFLHEGLPASMGWNFQTLDEVMRRCVGAIVFASPRRKFDYDNLRKVVLPTEWNHYEGAVAITLGLPTLIMVEKGTADTGIAYSGGGTPHFVQTTRC